MSDVFNPMVATISDGGVVPPGTYPGKFRGAEYLPESEGDPMTGKGARQYPKVKWKWEITEGEHAGKEVSADTGVSTGVKSGYYQKTCWVLGQNPKPGDKVDLTWYVGKQYLLTVGAKPGKTWVEVVNAMLMPGQ
jgi:hypothetical protein